MATNFRPTGHLRNFVLIALACAVLTITACSKKGPTAGVSTEAASAWTLALTVAPDHARMVRPATFSVHIADSSGKPVENAQLTASLNMTLMDMGRTELKFEPKGNGDYAAAVSSFDMSGPWELTVEAAQGPVHVHKTFQFTVFD